MPVSIAQFLWVFLGGLILGLSFSLLLPHLASSWRRQASKASLSSATVSGLSEWSGPTPSRPTPFDAFICYGHKDQQIAWCLWQALEEQRGLRIWLADRELLPGQDLLEGCSAGIRQSRRVILCASQDALSSFWVHQELMQSFQKEEELRKAGKDSLVVIPLDLDGTLRRERYEEKFKVFLKWRLALNFEGWQDDSDLFEERVDKLYTAILGSRTDAPS